MDLPLQTGVCLNICLVVASALHLQSGCVFVPRFVGMPVTGRIDWILRQVRMGRRGHVTSGMALDPRKCKFKVTLDAAADGCPITPMVEEALMAGDPQQHPRAGQPAPQQLPHNVAWGWHWHTVGHCEWLAHTAR